MVYHLVTAIPADLSLEVFTAELLRRVEDTLMHYKSTESLGRKDEDIKFRYTTPYEHCVMIHTPEWNDIVLDAIKCPATIDKRFIDERSRLDMEEDAMSHW